MNVRKGNESRHSDVTMQLNQENIESPMQGKTNIQLLYESWIEIITRETILSCLYET